MSTKSTLFLTNCCHIYKEVEYCKEGDFEKLCIDVDYLTVGGFESIEVLWNSDFAELIRIMLNTIDHDVVDQMCRDYWEKNIKDK